ncbi:T9SS type B sorting domain-containing protein [Williamwhitmania taraxaci]|uniref:Gliding motility-associated C-terminal domain-containing protein n=1 Tax=Williamwhitmania taraxaci TaxID=1640674 RepID=A0A1G6PGU9_9BACT|nr:gliding motility-associated C-terminal domain-containing protein [Williamwhitmania taraxaci]SDC78667.1 gliding motility-associated C-terminal domain-containing protein [Williamwhitmania taraxaci]
MKRFSTSLKLSFFLCFLLAGIANTTAQTLYWVSGSGSWSEPSHWAFSSGGAGGAAVPTLSNDVVFDKKSFPQPEATVTIDAAAYCNNLTWKGTEKLNPTLQGDKNTSLAVGGSLLLQDKIDNRFDGNIVFTANGEQKIVAKTPIKSNLLFAGTASFTVDEQAITLDKVKILDGSVTASGKLLEGSKPSNVIQASGGPKRVVTTIVATVVDVSCFGLSDGSLTITVTGGSPNYTYQIIDLSDFSYNFTQTLPGTVAVFSNIRAAQYIIIVKDASGIAKTNSYLVEQPTALSLVATPINITCSGANDGKITATATGGTANYTYTLKKGGVAVGLPQTVAGSYTFTGLVAGVDYSVEMNDVNSCGPITQGPLTIINPVALAGSVTAHTDILCFGQSTGSITATATVGTGTTPYEYRIDGGTYQATGTFNGLAAGNHSIRIRDVNGCTVDLAPYNLTQPAIAVSGSVSAQTNVSCSGGNNGSVTVAGAGGAGPYQYSLDGGAFQGSGIFATLTAKGYTVTVKDVNGCTINVPVTITQPTALGGSISGQTNVSCNGGNNGSVTVAGSGGTVTYQYSIGGAFQASGTFGTLTAGAYTVTVRDANLCTFNVLVTITQPTALSGSISAQTNVSCNGGNNGSVTIAGSAGTTPYQYSLNGGTYQASGTFGTLTAGANTVTVRDANLCTFNVPVNITQPASAVSVSTSSQVNVSCFGGNNGSVTVAGAGGTVPYEYSLNGGAYQVSGTFGTLIAGLYTVTVRDANSCTSNVAVTITQPASALSGSISAQINVLCKGNNTGSVTVAGAGGTAPYQYSLNGGAFQGSGTFGTLTAGAYTVTVRDVKTCTQDVAVTITEPATGVAGSITSQTNVLCFGDNSGSVTITGSGGTSPYQYSLNGGAYQASGTYSTLTSGPYTITVKDANGCTFIVPVTITQPANALTGSISSQTNVLCFGSLSGSVTITGVNGTLPYQYSFQGGAYAATNTFTNLAAGGYTVTVKDANGCLALVPITITQPALALSGTITAQTNVSCNGGNNGTVTVTGVGGTAPYQYSLDGGSYQASGTFGTLTAGSYTVTVKDANLCTNDVAITITQPVSAVTGSITTQTNINCFGGNDGAVTVAGAGGSLPYQYSINGGAYQASGTFGTLTAGAYTITVKDANSCTFDVSVTIIQPAASLTGSITSQTNLTCNGGNDGAVTVTASGGTAPYTYNIDGGTFGATATFTNLAGTAHTVIVKDANGCTFNIPVTLTQPAGINITSEVVVNVTGCFGNTNGSITLTASGGSGALTYSINGGTSFQATGSFLNIGAGSYQVIVKDSQGCTKNGSLLTVTQPTQVTFTNTTKDLTCNGSLNGEIHFTAAGGTPPYQYSILGGTPTSWKLLPDFTGLAAGTYSLKVKDANGCTTAAAIAKILQPAAIGTDGGTWQDVTTCNGANTGSITVNVTGGIPPFSFSINGGTTWQPTGVFLNLFAGTYSVIVKDGNGCTTTVGPNTINEPSKINITAEIVDDVTVCWYNTNGSIVVLATGGTGDLQFSIDGGTTWQADGFFNNLGVGTYQVAVKDDNGCIKNGSLLVVAGPPAIVIDPTTLVTNITCSGANDGKVNVVASGGTGTLSYSLDGGAPQATGAFTGLSAGNHTVVVSDGNDCVINYDFTITEPDAITFTSQAFTNITCNGANDGTITIVVAGGTAPYQYSIDGGLTFPNATGIFTGLGAGSFTVNVKDANGCILIGNTYVITNPAAITITSATSNNSGCFGSNSGTITVVAAGGSAPLSYTLMNGAVTVTTNATGAFTNVAAGTYTVEVSDANGCGPIVAGPFTITESTPITYTLAQTDLLCNGNPTGTITINITGGGTAPFTYLFDLGAVIPTITPDTKTATAINLLGGDHTITITDASGCDSTFTVTLVEPTLLTITPTGTNPLCSSAPWTGKITATSTGGTFSGANPKLYQLVRTSPTPWTSAWTTTPSFTALEPGDYTITVQDKNACEASASLTLVAPLPITITGIPVSVNPTCTDLGSITVAAQGGTPPFKFTLSPGGATITDMVQAVFTGLGANTYTISVTDKNSCAAAVTAPITLTAPSTLIITSVDVVNITPCFGGANGSLNINVAGATGTVQYSIDNGLTWFPTSLFTGLSADNYLVKVNDDNNCITGIPVAITQPDELIIIADPLLQVQPTVGNSDGEIHVTYSGGTPPVTFTISPNVGAQLTSGNFTGLPADTYTVTATDANGCSASTVIGLSDFTADITSTDVTCNGINDGTITITVGGTINFSITWTKDGLPYDAEMNAKYDGNGYKNLEPGVYVATVTDNISLKVIVLTPVTISEPAAIIITSVTVGAPDICAGKNQGIIAVEADPTGGPYEYSIDNGVTFVPTNVFSNLASGSYDVVVRVGLCTVAWGANPIVLDFGAIPEPIVVTQDPTSGAAVVCPDDETSTLVLTVSGGVPAYTYLWDDGSTSLNRTGLGKGDHTITVTDQNNCQLISTFSIGGPPAWSLTAVYDSVTCRYIPYGSSLSTMQRGKITVTASGASPGYIYDWQRISNDEATLPPFQFAGNVASDLYPSTSSFDQIYYVVNVTDAKDCKHSESYTLPYKVHIKTQIVSARMSNLIPVEYWDRDTACYNGHLLLSLDTLPVHRNFDSVFGWSSTEDNLVGINITNDSINPIFRDTTYIKAVVTKTVDGETCLDWDTLKVHLYPRLGVKIIKDEKFESENTIVLPESVSYNFTSTITADNIHPLIYSWGDLANYSPSIFTTWDNPNQTSIIIPPGYPLEKIDKHLYATIYAIALDTVTKCIDTSAVKVKVLKNINIPNAFSPNGDGINDTWAIWDITGVPINFLFPKMEVEVFNRWGSRVFYSSGYNKPWDGKAMNGGELPVGTYYFVIQYNKDGYANEVGSVTILR